uniref:Uncharacterized protein n=1 Tax=Ralstonia solanacearum TaxID=305 RepID=A0A0S4TQ52_RALSL|nr:protein of unknown function [Ralstonia solanacearum]
MSYGLIPQHPMLRVAIVRRFPKRIVEGLGN